MQVVTGECERVAVSVRDVSAGSQQQEQGIREISRGLQQMQGLNQSYAASEENAAAAEELSARSESLVGIIALIERLRRRKIGQPVTIVASGRTGSAARSWRSS